MPMIFTLDITISGWRTAEDAWSARIEVTQDFTLAELHEAILQLVEFDNDHLHAFFVGRTWRSRKVAVGEPADTPFGFNEGEDAPVGGFFPLPKGRKLFYHFDFGDDWLFEIARRRYSKQADPISGYPRVVHENGRPRT